jgi:hypothetical protein
MPPDVTDNAEGGFMIRRAVSMLKFEGGCAPVWETALYFFFLIFFH